LDAEAAARITGPSTMDGIGPADDWERYWRAVDERRRAGASWNTAVPGGASVPRT
jgi:phthalate 4,5-dioxygenase oxygenase subunit